MASSPLREPRTYREFIKAKKLRQPCATLDERGRVRLCGACDCRQVLDVIAAYPVAENVHRDEHSHELLTDFQERYRDDDGGLDPSSGTVALVNQQVYQDWLREAFD